MNVCDPVGAVRLAGRTSRNYSTIVRINPNAPRLATAPTSIRIGRPATINWANPVEFLFGHRILLISRQAMVGLLRSQNHRILKPVFARSEAGKFLGSAEANDAPAAPARDRAPTKGRWGWVEGDDHRRGE